MRDWLGCGFGLAVLLLGGAAAAQETQVGVAASVVPDATGTPPRGQLRNLAIGQDVVYSERIATGPIGRTQMLFLDGSALTVGPNSDVVLDEFVYDPKTETGKLAVSATKGVLRLVGGKISKTEPVTLKTPTATIGIRGGIAIYDNGQATFLFGRGMTVEAVQPDGSVTRIELVRPGTVNIGAGGQIGPVGPINQQAVAASLGALEGRSGDSGGASERPTEARVAATQIAALGSTNLPDAVAPTGDAVAPPITDVADGVTRDVDLRDIRTGAGDGGGGGSGGAGPRLFTGVAFGNPVFSSFNFSNTSAPHTGNFDRGAFGFAVGGTFFGFAPNAGVFAVLPFGSGGFFPVGPDSATSSAGRLSGDGFVNDNSTFFFYRLRAIDQGNNPLFIFGGVRNEEPVTFRTQTEFRAWQLLPGFPGDNQIPLLPAAFGGNIGGAVVSPLLAALRPNTPDTSVPNAISPTLFAAFAVEGQGPAQRSALMIRTGGLSIDANPNNPTFNKLRIGGSALGSVRLSATDRPIRVQDGSTTIFDKDGFAFYGAEGQQPSFVLGSDLYTADPGFPYQDSAAFAQPFTNLNQSNEYYAAHPALPAPNLLPSGIGAARSNRVLNGYAAGIAEARVTAASFVDYRFTSSSNPGHVAIATDASRNRMAATFKIQDVAFSFQQFNLVFGDLESANGSRSAFIDDRRFGARQSADDPSQVNGVDAAFANLAMVSYDVVPNTNFFAAGTGPCACQFVQWGFFSWDAQGQTGPRTRGHINPWVAGELPAIGTLPTTGMATYNGHAVGNVRDAAGNLYIAGGSYQQTWFFASQTGSAQINSFDGRNLSASGLTGSNGGRDFAGGLTGPNSGTGNLNGSFVRGGGNPAAEVMGQFSYSETSGYRAGGIVAGRQ